MQTYLLLLFFFFKMEKPEQRLTSLLFLGVQIKYTNLGTTCRFKYLKVGRSCSEKKETAPKFSLAPEDETCFQKLICLRRLRMRLM